MNPPKPATAVSITAPAKTAKGCNLASNAPIYGLYQAVTGSGSVRYS